MTVSEPAQDGAPVELKPWQRRSEPFGRSRKFVDLVTAARGPQYVKSWLTIGCLFQEQAVWTSDVGAERLRLDCGKIAEDLDVKIRSDDQSREHFRQALARYGKP